MVVDEVLIVPANPLVAQEVGAVSVTSPAGVLDLVDYSSSNSDPLEDSLPPAPELPLVSSFLCSDDSEAYSKSESDKERPERHESLVVHDFPISPVVAPPRIRRRPVILIRPGDAIPFGLPYRTHPNGPRKLLTVRKRVRPLTAHRLAWRCVSYCSSDHHSSPDFTSDSSSYGSSSNSSSDTFSGSSSDSLLDTSSVHSSGCDASGQTYSGPSTRVASSRSLDSSSLSAGPSHKRCRSPTTLLSLSTPVLRSIAPTHVDLLTPRKRFRDSYSPEDSREEHMEIGTTDAEAVVDLGIGDAVGVDTEDSISIGVEIPASDNKEDKEAFEAEASTGGTMEIAIDLLATGGISESTRGDRQLEAGQLMASGERAGLFDRIRRLGWENLRVRALLCIERDRVDSLCHHMELSQEKFCQIRRDHDDDQRRLRRLESFVERHLGFRP
ncbi:hypothetical protein Tco_0537874 [Tanacetum coccineum]